MAEEPTPCDSFKSAAIQCVAMDTTGSCASCIDLESFATDFPKDIKTLFASTQAFAIPGTSQFCSVANDRICAEVEGNWSCCCKEEVAAYQNCLVEQVYSAELSLPQPCSSVCGGSGSGSGGFPVGIVAGIAVVAIVAAGLAWFFCRRRRMRAAAAKSDDDMGSHKDAVEDAPLNDLEEGVNTSISNDSDERSDKHKRYKERKSRHNHEDSKGKETTNIEDPTPAMITSAQIDDEEKDDRHDLSKQVSSTARHKKHAIEQWHKSKKAGSNRSLESFMSGEDAGMTDEDLASDEESSVGERKKPSRISSKKNLRDEDRDGSRSEKTKLPKKISSRDLSRIMKDSAESTKRVTQLEDEKARVEDRLARADREAEALRREREENQRLIEELSAQNKLLKKELKSGSEDRSLSSSKHRSSSRERKSSRDRSSDRKSSRDRSSDRKSSRERSRERRERSRSRSSSRTRSHKDKSKSTASFKDSLSKLDDLTTNWDHKSLSKNYS
mmetsp:Transcript_25130/g.44012  ORF Transcript_25130/g.44012 Transcript_25130/m.44012 type:complete len:499 (+) Transcript_25130:44-1540(+)